MTTFAFVCAQCHDLRKKYRSVCPTCDGISTLIPIAKARARGLALPIGMNGGSGKRLHHMLTGLDAVNEMTSKGGGLVRGKCYMMSADPGSGKSTVWLQVGAFISRRRRVIYAYLEEGEDTAEAMMLRLGLPIGRMLGIEAENLEQLFARIAGADLVILDSLQGLRNRCGMAEEKLAEAIGNYCHETGTTFVIISHVNKDGEAHGRMETQHWVDCVLELSGEKGDALRLLAASKSRLGPTDRVRFLRMTERGLTDVPDASSYLLADRTPGQPGSAIAAVLLKRGEGTAAVLVEVQALLAPVPVRENGTPARPGRVVCDAVDAARLRIILSILSQKTDVDVDNYDITVNVCGDMAARRAISDRGLDLPVALAVASAARHTPLPEVCSWGELDLIGHVRGVASKEQRFEEAKRAGFKPAGRGVDPKKGGMPVESLQDALDSLLIDSESEPSDTAPRGKPPVRQAVPGRAPGPARSPRKAADAREPDAGRARTVRVSTAARRVRAKSARRRV